MVLIVLSVLAVAVVSGSSNWSRWSPCSASCGGGTQSRTRKLSTEGKEEERMCNMKKCYALHKCQPNGIVTQITANQPPGNVEIKLGSKESITCKFSNIPHMKNLTFRWYRMELNGKKTPVDRSQIKIVSDGENEATLMLSFSNFTEKDIGEYMCVSKGSGYCEKAASVQLFAKGYCYRDNRLHALGQRFVSSDCGGTCKCDKVDSIACVSLCPPHTISCSPGHMIVPADPKVVSNDPKCTCKEKKCISSENHCFFEDKLYAKGESFASSSCATCRCEGGDSISCVSMCPPQVVKCNLDEMIYFKRVKVKDHCSCVRKTCIKIADACKLPPKAGPCYANFQRYHYHPASGTCKKFTYGGCASNPNNFVKKVTCENKCEVVKNKMTTYAISNSAVKIMDLGDCYIDDQWYAIGESVRTQNCEQKCKCTGMMAIECTPLCNEPNLKCPAGEIPIIAPWNPWKPNKIRCSCKEKKCAKIASICNVKPEAGSCMAYYPRWYFHPASQTCLKFIYGGCEANLNNFETKEDCSATCIIKNAT